RIMQLFHPPHIPFAPDAVPVPKPFLPIDAHTNVRDFPRAPGTDTPSPSRSSRSMIRTPSHRRAFALQPWRVGQTENALNMSTETIETPLFDPRDAPDSLSPPSAPGIPASNPVHLPDCTHPAECKHKAAANRFCKAFPVPGTPPPNRSFWLP